MKLVLTTSFRMNELSVYENINTLSQKNFAALHTECSLCCTPLELKIEIQKQYAIKEVAHCPQCKLRLGSKLHPLH